MKDLINSLEYSFEKLDNGLVKDIELKIEEVRFLITGLIGIEQFEYENLLRYKRSFLEKNNISIKSIDLYFNKKQIQLLNNYREELYESAIYGSPIYETEERKMELEIGEQLYFISNKIEEIIKHIKKDN